MVLPFHSINHVFLRAEVFIFRSLIHPFFSFMDCHSIFKKFFSALFLKIISYSIQAGLRKGRGTRDQLANIYWIIEKAREFQKNIYFCFINYAKDFDCVDHRKLWEMLKEMAIPDHLTCLLGNLYAGQEATGRIGHGTIDWLQIGKGVCQDCILSPCLLNLYAEYTRQNVGLDEAQTGIKTVGRNINNLRYADDTTLMAERGKELKSLLKK